jgi:hypothetical protein
MCALCLCTQAQSQAGRLDDKQRVALTAVVMDDDIPQAAARQLLNKMTQIVTKGGCAGISNSRFVITCSADVLTKDIVPGPPTMHAYTLSMTFFIGDGVEGRLFSSTSVEVKGVGETPEKAYINAFKSVRVNDPAFKPFVEKGRQGIIDYYNTQCELILTEARTKAERQEYTKAIEQLTAVPAVCEECYNKAQDASVEVYKAWRDNFCRMALTKAKSAWTIHDAKTAVEILGEIPPEAECAAEAEALRAEIAEAVDEKARREWELVQQQGVQIEYKIKGNWFD